MFAFSFSHGEMLYLLFIIEKLYFNTVGIIVNCHWRRLQSQVKRVHRHIKKEKKSIFLALVRQTVILFMTNNNTITEL